MPDGDVIHPNLSQAYRQAYAMLCEGQFSDERIADSLTRTIKERVRRVETKLLRIVSAVAGVLDGERIGPLFDVDTDWGSVCEEVTRTVQTQNRGLRLDRRMAALVELAGRQQLSELRAGAIAGSLSEEITQKVMRNFYAAEFEEKVPLTDAHANGIDQATMDGKLASIRPSMSTRLNDLASYLVRQGTVRGMKSHRSQGIHRCLSVDTALDDIGR